jgi:hypothetical protein
MDFHSTFEKIESSKIFKRFKKENPKAELVAGFFVLDLLKGTDEKSLDYKTGKKIFTFLLSNSDEITLREDELIKDPRFPELKKISPKVKVDLDEIPSIANQAAIENNLGSKFQKIIAVLQIFGNNQAWNLTCILDGFIILNIIIDSGTGEILKFERKNMADFIKKTF